MVLRNITWTKRENPKLRVNLWQHFEQKMSLCHTQIYFVLYVLNRKLLCSILTKSESSCGSIIFFLGVLWWLFPSFYCVLYERFWQSNKYGNGNPFHNHSSLWGAVVRSQRLRNTRFIISVLLMLNFLWAPRIILPNGTISEHKFHRLAPSLSIFRKFVDSQNYPDRNWSNLFPSQWLMDGTIERRKKNQNFSLYTNHKISRKLKHGKWEKWIKNDNGIVIN
jgi:hypothetical protein